MCDGACHVWGELHPSKFFWGNLCPIARAVPCPIPSLINFEELTAIMYFSDMFLASIGPCPHPAMDVGT